MANVLSTSTGENHLANVRKKIEGTYLLSMSDDRALDLFDPSVEALLLPFMNTTVTPRPTILSQVPFDEYFFADEYHRDRDADRTEREPWVYLESPCRRVLDMWSIPRPCLRVQGKRGRHGISFTQLFMGDLLWLFFHERMGVQRMVGAILDDFVTKGRFPIRPANYEGVMIEAMVREVKSGLSSTVRDRDTTYRRCLGWTSESGSKLPDQDAPKNAAFSIAFHRLIEVALGYYNERRLASAIQNTINVGKPSMATITTVRDSISELRKTFDPFKYGRNHTHTLMGIVWTVAGLELVHRLRNQLGIPEPFDRPDELVPAAYDLLVGGEKMNGNRYTAHRDCATSGRAILLDVQGLDIGGPTDPTDLEIAAWLDDLESTFENYRTAYRVMTGVDLGTPRVSVVQAA